MRRNAINISLALGVFLVCLGLEPAEARSEGVASARCAANSGQRYMDLRDGTVLDCNTRLIWLKDASCADLPGADPAGKVKPSEGRGYRASWEVAKHAAAALADGMCGLTDGSSAGDWRMPTISEFCSAWLGSALSPCPASASSNSLINSDFSEPAVSNTTGDARWSPGDAFVGVEPMIYWSATAGKRVGLKTGKLYSTAPGAFVWPVRGEQ